MIHGHHKVHHGRVHVHHGITHKGRSRISGGSLKHMHKGNIEHLKNELKGLVLGHKPKPKHKKRIHF